MVDEYEVVIIGARVAGATLAAHLGDSRISTLLVDAAGFPSSTLSTHFFRGSGLVSVLDRLDVLDEVRSLGAPLLVREYHYQDGLPDHVRTPAQAPGNVGFNLSVRREPLDHLLLRRAVRGPHVDFSENTRAITIDKEGDRVVGVALETPMGKKTVRCKLLVGADGRRTIVARELRATTQEAAPASRAIYYRYVTGFVGPSGELDGPEFSLRGDEMAYVFPSDAGRTCVALSLNLATFRWFREDPESRFAGLLQQHQGIWDRFYGATSDGGVLGCGPEPNYVRMPSGPGWALVGDAGMHQDPWTGLGMDNAGMHATFLAESVTQGLHNGASLAHALGEYQRRRDDHALLGYRETVRLAQDLRQLKMAQLT
ncbi:MAG: NAD(P)/FAD-dependent oxidoreductase [Thermoplasmata archaeon]|nr:NAD(P)/FAD-dependent oxidoreductase [Thermoplasmata archaeon]